MELRILYVLMDLLLKIPIYAPKDVRSWFSQNALLEILFRQTPKCKK